MKQNESNKQRVLRVHPKARCVKNANGDHAVWYGEHTAHGDTEREAWRHARRQIDRHAEADLHAAINELVEVITA